MRSVRRMVRFEGIISLAMPCIGKGIEKNVYMYNMKITAEYSSFGRTNVREPRSARGQSGNLCGDLVPRL